MMMMMIMNVGIQSAVFVAGDIFVLSFLENPDIAEARIGSALVKYL